MAIVIAVVIVAGAVLWLFAYGPAGPGRSVDPSRAAAPPASVEPGPAEPADRVSERACAVEAALVGHLLAGTLAAPDYHRAMAELAATDAVRQPVRVPHGPTGPAGSTG